MDWFPYDNGLRHERVKRVLKRIAQTIYVIHKWELSIYNYTFKFLGMEKLKILGFNIEFPVSLIRTCAHQRVRNDRFSENFTCFFFLVYLRFEIRPFALLPTNYAFLGIIGNNVLYFCLPVVQRNTGNIREFPCMEN